MADYNEDMHQEQIRAERNERRIRSVLHAVRERCGALDDTAHDVISNAVLVALLDAQIEAVERTAALVKGAPAGDRVIR